MSSPSGDVCWFITLRVSSSTGTGAASVRMRNFVDYGTETTGLAFCGSFMPEALVSGSLDTELSSSGGSVAVAVVAGEGSLVV